MLAKVTSCAVIGLDGELVEVEVDISSGLPAFTIVGLPDTAVQESKERVRSAIRNCGLTFPQKRITVNLAPADIRKEGPSYDLPIAIGILMASEQVTADVSGSLFLGELSLDGQVRHTHGILPMAALAREKGIGSVFVPAADGGEAALIGEVEIMPVASLGQLTAHLQGLLAGHGRQDGGQRPREERLARAGRPAHEHIVAASRRHLQAPLDVLLPLDVAEVHPLPRWLGRGGTRRLAVEGSDGSQPLEMSRQLPQAGYRHDLHLVDEGRLAAVGRGDEDSADAFLPGQGRHGQYAVGMAHLPIQR